MASFLFLLCFSFTAGGVVLIVFGCIFVILALGYCIFGKGCKGCNGAVDVGEAGTVNVTYISLRTLEHIDTVINQNSNKVTVKYGNVS